MLIEMAIGTAVSFLWGELAGAAESKDSKTAIKKALEESIAESFNHFQEKYTDFAESFFTEELLERQINSEILKLLTRSEQPSVGAVVSALPDHVVLASSNEYKDEINDFFEMVMSCMKKHAVLQQIISHRQAEETSQVTKETLKGQKEISESIGEGFSNVNLKLAETDEKMDGLVSLVTEQIERSNSRQSNIPQVLPVASNDGLSKLLNKHLDRTRELINRGQVNDAHELLLSMGEEVELADNYTRFRWHTNVGACLLSLGEDEQAAQEYFKAYDFEKGDDKAVVNRIRAYLLTNQLADGLTISKSALIDFPKSGLVWALHIVAMKLSGNLFDTSLLPSDLENDEAILLVLSDMKLREGKFKESFELAKKGLSQSSLSNDGRRAMLVSAVSWATMDLIKSSFRHFTDEQREALNEAVTSFGNVLDALGHIQSRNEYIEVAHNLLYALELLGEEKTKEIILANAFSKHPTENVFIYFKVKELKKADDVSAIRKLTDEILGDLDKTTLILLAEISSNRGDLEWLEAVLECLGNKELDEHDHNEMLGMRVCAIWKSGDHDKALTRAQKNIQGLKASPTFFAFYIRMLDEHGEQEKRDHLLDECCKEKVGDPIALLVFADLMFDFGRFFDASEKYSKLVEIPGDDRLTKQYLDALIKAGKKSDALTVLDLLPVDVRAQSDFRRLEANLALDRGDLEKLEEILASEIALHPLDSSVAVGYASVLHRRNKAGQLNEFLGRNQEFDPVIDTHEIEFTKYQIFAGFETAGMRRMYNLFRAHPNDSSIAGQYLILLLQLRKTDDFQNVSKVLPGVVVYCEGSGQKRTIVIEDGAPSEVGGWPECTNENTPLAKNLIGRERGELVELDMGGMLPLMEIVRIESIFLFASNKAHEVLAKTTSSYGPVWSLNLVKEDGELDVKPLIQQLKSRREHVERVFSIYEKEPVSLSMLADVLGGDVLTLLLDWPFNQSSLFVGVGTHEEREGCLHLINANNRPYVLELAGLVELARVGVLTKCLTLFGKPLVTQSLIDQLQRLRHLSSAMNPTSNMTEVDGRISIQDIHEKSLENRKSFIQGLLDFIADHCEIVPVLGPQTVTQNHVAMGKLLGGFSQDAIDLVLERNAILVTEDGALSGIAKGMGVEASINVQPILTALRDRGLISAEAYSKIILDKIKRQHDFTSVTANDLFLAVKASNGSICPDVERVFESFKNPSLELKSGVVVGSQFLQLLVSHVSPKVLLKYYELVLNALLFGREQFAIEINKALRDHIILGMGEVKKKKFDAIIQVFGERLLEPVRALPALNPLVSAIRRALK